MSIYHRQSDIFDPTKINQMPVHVIGCGTIGSWTVFALHKMGIQRVKLYDFDRVEDINVPSQNFEMKDVGKPKSVVLGKRYAYDYHNAHFNYDGIPWGIYILAVDSLEARREILAMLPDDAVVIDGRMGGEGYEVHFGLARSITVPWEASEDLCTAKGIVYVSMGIASEITATVKRIMSGQEMDYRIKYRDYRCGDTLTIKRV